MSQRQWFDNTDRPKSTYPDWMSKLPDDIPIDCLSIPGTHNTMAFYGGASTECQSWALADQLMAGVRFLDVRCRHHKDGLHLHHGVVYQRGDFHDVLSAVSAYLAQHRMEFVVMRLRKEHTADDNTSSMESLIRDYMRFYDSSLFWKELRFPTVREARGRVIILSDGYESVSGDIGIPYRWLNVGDQWKVPSLWPKTIDNKWESVKDHLDATAGKAASNGVLYLTFSSGASALAYPNAVADRINPKLFDYLYLHEQSQQLRCWGMIAMDFPGVELVHLIIESNFP